MKGSAGSSSAGGGKDGAPRLFVDTDVHDGEIGSSTDADLLIALPGTSGQSKGSVSVPWKDVLKEAFKHPSLIDAMLLHISSVPGGRESAIKILSAGADGPVTFRASEAVQSHNSKILGYALPSPASLASSRMYAPPERPAHLWDQGHGSVSRFSGRMSSFILTSF